MNKLSVQVGRDLHSEPTPGFDELLESLLDLRVRFGPDHRLASGIWVG